jgi:hypothetical protein
MIIVLQFAIRILRLDKLLLQNLRSSLSLLNLEEMFLVEFRGLLRWCQLLLTVSKKPSCSVQKFSNLKMQVFGILVFTNTCRAHYQLYFWPLGTPR